MPKLISAIYESIRSWSRRKTESEVGIMTTCGRCGQPYDTEDGHSCIGG